MILVGCLVIASGCLSDAEHSNPLDPRSDDFENTGAVAGSTTRFYPPFTPMEDVEVRLTPGPFVARSGPDGRFTLLDVPVGEYAVHAERAGFLSRSDTLTVSLGTTTGDVSLRLDGLPVVRSFDLRTVHISRWWPQDELYMLEIAANVEDPDGVRDLTNVRFEIPAFEFEHELEATGIAGRYQSTLLESSLPAPTLHALQGTEFVLTAQDAAEFQTVAPPRSIIRVIDETPVAREPQNLTSVEGGRPLLVWEDVVLPYAFTYRIDIVRDEANVQALVLTAADIQAPETSYQVEAALPSGTYFWTVTVVDDFGNRSRSKEAGFVVP